MSTRPGSSCFHGYAGSSSASVRTGVHVGLSIELRRVYMGRKLTVAEQLQARLDELQSDQGRRVPVRDLPSFEPVARRAMLDGDAGARLLAIVENIPGFWGLWDRRVPASALSGEPPVVSCTCRAQTTLTAGLTACEGACGRYFLRVADAVLARKFEDEEATAA